MPPPDVNDAALELLERRIADRVTEQARGRVFAYYAVIGTTVAAVLGLVGWSAVGWVERQASSAISEQIAKRTEEVDTTSRKLRDLQTRMETQLSVLDALAGRAGRTVDRVEATLAAFEPKSRRLEQAASDIDELEERVRPLRGATDLAERNRGDLERLGAELASLAQQVKALIEVNRAAAPAAPAAAQAYGALAGATDRVVSGAATITQEIAASRERTTVYVQFAGLDRARLDDLAKDLADKGFTFPPAERTDAASRLFEVRYFWPGDEAAARRLAALATTVAHDKLGDPREARVQDLTRWTRTKPRQGTIELWYGAAPK